MKYSYSYHRPLHIYADDTWYFITASTLNRTHILNTAEHRLVWCNELFKIIAALKIELAAWVILKNHYHVLLKLHEGRDLSKFTKLLHGRTSFQLNQLDNSRGRQIWYSYWDICMRSEGDFWTRFNYIHYNPVRHGYVKSPEDWEFSSYQYYLQEEGQEWLAECLREYPEVSLIQEDNF